MAQATDNRIPDNTGFVIGIPAEQYIPPVEPGFCCRMDHLLDQALKEFTTEDNIDEVTDCCHVILADPDNPYTQHVYDALRLLVVHAQASRVQQAISDQFMARFRQATSGE